MYKDSLSFLFDTIFCLAAFYGVYWFLLRKEKSFLFNRILLLSAVIFSFVIPFVSITSLFNKKIESTFSSMTDYDSFISTINTTYLVERSTSILPQQNQFQPVEILLTLYAVVAVILLIKIIVGLVKLSKLIRGSGVQKKYDHTIVYLKGNYSPFSFLNYIFINEKENGGSSLTKIINHEKVHIDQNHSIDNLLLELVSAIQWYNPFVWLIKKEIKVIHEYIADEKVIAQGIPKAEYSSFLLNEIVGISAVGIASCFNKSLIKRRIQMMEKQNRSRFGLLKKFIVVPLSLVLLAFTVTSQVGNSTMTNLGFQSTDGIPEGWFKAGSHPLDYKYMVDKNVVLDGNPSILISSKSKSIIGFGTLMQTISAENYLGKRIRLSGAIKTESVEKSAAFWMRIDKLVKDSKENPSVAFDNMSNRSAKGTTDWKKFEIVLDVPDNAFTVNYGMMLSGTGKSWFGGLNIEEVTTSVPVTDLRKTEHTLPKNPVNLKFN
ncbi:MAG: peptidase M56 BlaR1 [Stygiobacter sp.]|nr:MAG: peptidase M56 BlaR1 [Stygiobacter sp.]KAF0214663.1 MAG: peptidase M56 [Ignavibacteria bacterium]